MSEYHDDFIQRYLGRKAFRFNPPGPAGITLSLNGPFNKHHTSFKSTIALLVISSMLFGIGVLLLLLTAVTYIKRRKTQAIKPFFFVSAIASGMNLLVLCATHIKATRIRLGTSLGSAAFGALLSFDEIRARYGADHEGAQIISQLENISLVLLGFVLLMRVHTLCPGEQRIQRTVKLLSIACGASFILSISLQITNSPVSFLRHRDSINWMMIIEVFQVHAYISGCLSIIINGFVTWTFFTRWRYIKHVTNVNGCRGSRKNLALQRLIILVLAGLLLGILQLSWYIYFTIISIDINQETWPTKKYDYVFPRFIFYAGSSLYPVATYVATHWNTPSEEIHCVDLFGIPDGQDCDVALDNLGQDTGVDGFDGDGSLIDFDAPSVGGDA